MSLWPTKPPGYFGRQVSEEKLARFLRYGLPVGPVGPDEITVWGVVLDGSDLVFTITAPAANDAVRFGDGLGVITDLLWTFDGSAEEFSFGSTVSGAFTVPVPAGHEGETLLLTVRAHGTAGAGPWATAPIGVEIPEAQEDDFAGAFLLEDGSPIQLEASDHYLAQEAA